MQPMLNIGIRAARAAGSVMMRYLDRLDTLSVTSKATNDFVSEVDRESERVIIETIHKSYPNHGILGEESGRRDGDGEHCWVIDPLDGTTNYLHGFPQFAVSIALLIGGRPEQAVIFDPLRREMFTASRGAGAQLDGRRMRVSRRGLNGALLGTGFPFSEIEALEAYLETMKAFVPHTAGIRRAGAAALDLAYVAAGRLDGFWEYGLKPWDLAAGALLVQEAGGLVSDMSGGDGHFETGDVVAANPRLHGAMVKTLTPYARPRDPA